MTFKVDVNLDSDDLFDHLSNWEEKELRREIIEGSPDDLLVTEVVSRELAYDILNELSPDELDDLMESFGYTKKDND